MANLSKPEIKVQDTTQNTVIKPTVLILTSKPCRCKNIWQNVAEYT